MDRAHEADKTDVDEAEVVAGPSQWNEVGVQHQQVGQHDGDDLVEHLHSHRSIAVQWVRPLEEDDGRGREQELTADLAPEEVLPVDQGESEVQAACKEEECHGESEFDFLGLLMIRSIEKGG